VSTIKLSLIGLGTRLILAVVNVVSVIVLARYLEPQGRGEYFLFQAMVSVLTVFGDLGLSQSANVFSGRHGDRVSAVHSVLVRLVLVLWVGLIAVGGGIVFLFGDKLLPNFPLEWQLVAFAVLPITLYAGFWNSMMVGMGQIWVLNMVQLVISPCQLILVGVFVIGLSGGVLSAVSIYVATMVIQGLLMLVLAFRLGLRGSDQGTLGELARQMVSFGLRGYVGSVSSMVWMRIPVFLLNIFHGPVSVGIFSVAQQLAEKVLLPMQAVQDAIYRKMSTFSGSEATQATNRYLRIVSSGMVMVVLVGMLIAPWVVMFLFGQSYLGAAYVFRVLLVGTAFISVSMILGTYLLGQRERPGLLSLLAGANALVCLLLSFLFIPAWAEVGAASALALTQLLGTVIVFAMYLGMSSTPVKDALLLNSQDMALLFKRISGMTWRKRLQV
jgi:O-antigen/teichoic acid export membrane protein